MDEVLLERREEALLDRVVVAQPLRPIETSIPASQQVWPKISAVYWEPGTLSCLSGEEVVGLAGDAA
jgi:hypothetical protein